MRYTLVALMILCCVACAPILRVVDDCKGLQVAADVYGAVRAATDQPGWMIALDAVIKTMPTAICAARSLVEMGSYRGQAVASGESGAVRPQWAERAEKIKQWGAARGVRVEEMRK